MEIYDLAVNFLTPEAHISTVIGVRPSQENRKPAMESPQSFGGWEGPMTKGASSSL